MKTKIVFTVLLIAFTAGAAANSIDVQPEEYSFDIVAGSTYQQDLTVTWHGDNPTALSAETIIDGERTSSRGVNVRYSENPVAMMPGDSKSVTVIVDTSEALKPDNFTFDTRYKTSVTVDDDEGTNRYYTVQEGDLNKSREKEIVSKLNESKKENKLLEKRIEALTSLLEDKAENTSDSNRSMENKTSQSNTDEDRNQSGVIKALIQWFVGWFT